MDEERMRCIVSGIKMFGLTGAEEELVRYAEQSMNQNQPLGKTAELILEGIYRRKTKFIRHSIISMLKEERPKASFIWTK